MGSTNSTVNYSLSQFVSTDKPAWLQDYNGDMLKIDTAIKSAKTAADTAQTTADTANSAAGSNATAITALQTTVTGLNTSVTNIQGSVNTIEALIGNGIPTTTDHTIIGAINEMNAYRHLKKVGRIDTSLASTLKAAWDTAYTYLASNFTNKMNGVLVMSTGGQWNVTGSGASGAFDATTTYISGANFAFSYASIKNGTSFHKDAVVTPSGNTITDFSNNSNGYSWIDVYAYE